MSADQNLLFGVLALQADLLDPARFAEACSAWAARKDMPLADLLVQLSWLSPEDRVHVDYLLQRKLKKHKGDVRASLAEVTTAPVRQSLASVADADVQQSLAELPQSGSTTAYQPQGRGRYTLTNLHATGGIGQVWLAHDADLGRDVALKELRPERQEQAAAQARFLEEACITGQLEHPGIVPVHELVRPAEGQPFYTMRLVRGRTLAEAIKDYHRKRQAGEAGPLELRTLLGAFVAVCNALDYAHSRGVLHRDLKPANVVLGDYGEVVVLDWGLAKVVGKNDASEDATSLLPVSLETGSRDETVQGQVLGTPAYMAPEQAEGRLDLLGPATDVYGLGAILCELLTGLPPFTGGPSDEILRRVLREEPERPRQRVLATPMPLEAVCLKALAKKPSARYASAGELAREVERWLADEPVQAWREPARVRAGRWVRRHQPLVAALAAGLLAVLLLGGAGAVWLGREQERQRAAAESALERVAVLQQEAKWGEARATLEQAQARLGESGSADLRQRLAQTRADLELVARLDAIRMERARVEGGKWDSAGADRKYAEAFAEAGLGEVGDDEDAVAQRVAESAVREALVAALDDWAFVAREKKSRRVWLLAVARGADPHPWRDRLRQPALWQDEDKLAQVVWKAPASALTPLLATALGRLLFRRAEGEALLRSAQQSQPGDFWLNYSLGYALVERGKPQEAVGYLRAALALRPDSSNVWLDLGWAMDRQGTGANAEALYRKAIELDPRNALAHANLGWILQGQGKKAEAEALFRKAIELDPRNALAHTNLGWILQGQGKKAEAEALYRKAIELDPRNSMAYTNLGVVREQQGKLAETEALYRKAIELDPRNALAHANLGWILQGQGKKAEAEALYRKAIELDPRNSVAHNNLGLVRFRQGKLAEAEALYRKAIELDPRNSMAHSNLGTMLQRQGKLEEAEVLLRKAIDLDLRNSMAHNNLGVVRQQQGKLAEAEARYRKAIELDPRNSMAHSNLGTMLQRQGKLEEAEVLLRKAIDLDPRNALAHNNLGWVLKQQGKLAEALPLYHKALALDQNNASVRARLALAQRMAALEPKLPALLKGKFRPQRNDDRLALAYLCIFRRLYRASAGIYADAFAADPKLADDLKAHHRYDAACYAALAAAGKGKDAATLDDREKTRLRGQALAWLQADLALWSKQLDSGKPADRVEVAGKMRHWQQDVDLAGFRGKEALAKLPEAERSAWAKLWADVAALLVRASAP